MDDAALPAGPDLLTDGVVAVRPWRPSDADAVVAACQDPEIARWTTVPSPYGRAEAETFLARAIEHDARRTAVWRAVVDAADDDRLLGAIGLEHPSPITGELGYWVAADERGRGVARRALVLLTRWALEVAELEVCTLQVIVGNEASERVAAAAGYDRAGGISVDHGGEHLEVSLWRCVPVT